MAAGNRDISRGAAVKFIALMGILYDVSVVYLVIFSVAMQVLSVPLFIAARLKVE